MNATIAPTTSATPSVAPAPAAPALPAATTPAAPSAPEMDPSNLAYYDRLASEALIKGSQTAPAAASASGNGSPPVAEPAAAPVSAAAPVAPAAVPVVAPPANGAEPQPPVQTSEPADEPEPTPEEQATWTEGERRLHKALVKEREKNKESRKQFGELKEKLDKLTTPPASDPNAPPTPAQRPPRALEECHTPEAVEHLTVEAISMDGKMTRLAAALQRNNTAGVIQFLKTEGKQKIGETPIDEATPEQLSEYVTSVQEGARFIQAQSEPRKRFLSHQTVAWNKATEMIPELKTNPNSDRAKAFVALVQQNPWLRQQGPNWPIIAAKYLIGDERTNAPATPAAATAPVVTPQPAPQPATARPAPAAPRTAPVAPAPGSEIDRLRGKMTDGSATEADIDRYAALSINAPAPAQA